MNGKYYWLKLKKDFFKRHDIRIIESMPNGKDYILFYLKLLVESVDHDGNLRFSDTIPYNDEMLSVITNTNIDIVKSALEVFINLKMVDILDDQTIYMNEVEKLIGAETDWAIKKREYRTQKRQIEDNVLPLSDKSKSKSKSIEIDKEIDIEKRNIKEKTRFEPPTVEEVYNYCQERNNGIDAETFVDYYESKGWMIGKNKMKDWKACVRTWEGKRKERTQAIKNPNPVPEESPFKRMLREEGYSI